MRARPTIAALVAVVLLAGCSTSVAGSGRPGPAMAGGAGSASAGSSSASPSGSASSSGKQPLDIWNDAVYAIARVPAVSVTGSFSGAAFGGDTAVGSASIEASYGIADGDPLAQATVTTANAGAIEVRATGGTAWVKASAGFLQIYGYTPEEAAAAGDKWAVMTDDDKGIDLFASLSAFLQIVGPDESDADDITASPTTVDGQDAVSIDSETLGGSVVVTTDPPRVLSSTFSGDALTFSYPASAPTVEAPPADQVVTVPDF